MPADGRKRPSTVFDGPRLLFVPVSGAFGMGEYARSLNLALACAARWPTARIHFIISAQARYASSVPFDHTALPSSPTFHTPEVAAVIASFAPDAVIFDNAGRTAQLVAAKRAGARIIYISARPHQRRKAFRWRWMRLLDEHWIAYPGFMAGPITWFEQLKLNILERPVVRFLDCILPEPEAAVELELLRRVPAAASPFVLIVPGGGTGHPRARDAIDAFRATALALAQSGINAVFVGPGGASMAATGHLTGLELLPLAQLLALLRRAQVVLSNGGDTLIQAIALQVPAVAVAIAGDQPARIRAAVREGAAVQADVDPAQMLAAVSSLFADAAARERQQVAGKRLRLSDALSESVIALATLLR